MSVLSGALVAFDERRADPTVNLGTLGSAGDVAYTGTVRLAPSSTAYVRLPGVGGNNLSVPDEVALDITGDIEIVRRVAMADWTPAVAGQALLNKGSGSGTGGGYSVEITPGGAMALRWHDSGGTLRTRTSSAVIPGAVAVNGTALWLKWTLDVDNGASGHDVRFWYAADQSSEPSSWTQLGTTSTTAGVTNIAANAQPLLIGTANPLYALDLNAVEYRAIVRNGIGGSTALDVDTSVLTDEGATSFTATTGQTVTINRSTGATYKTEVVVPNTGSRLFNGTSDFGEVADLAGLDFGASDSFTVFALVRQWGVSTTQTIVAKRQGGATSDTGYRLDLSSGTARWWFADGTALSLSSRAVTAGALDLTAGVRDVTADTLTTFVNGSGGTPVTDTTTGSLANAFTLRVGRLSGFGATYWSGRLYAWGVFPGALTSAQLTALRTALIGTGRTTGTRTLDVSVPARTLDISVPQRTLSISVPERTLDVSVPSRTLDISVPQRTLEISA